MIRVFGAVLLFLPNAAASLANNVITAFVQIWANKVRSFLTVLGIIIAVTSIIVVVSMTQGFGNYVTNYLRGLGTNLMVVFPQSIRNRNGERIGRAEMNVEDVFAVDRSSDAVRRTTPMLFMNANVEFGRERVDGVDLRCANELFQPIRNYYCDVGRFFSGVEVDSANQVCVVGREVLRKLDVDESILGDYLHIDGQRFKVVGILEAKGSFMGDNQDEIMIIPWTTGLKMYPEYRRYMAFYAEAMEEDKVAEAEAQMRLVLRRRHQLDPEQPDDFGVFKQDQILRDFGQIRTYATSILAGIVGISLLVGGIGIMNVMLVSVTERTREIGLRKSVGARRRDIMMQFLTEAVVLSILGGAVGVTLGYLICYVASLHPGMVEVSVPFWSVALALGFSAGSGIFFGIVPAMKAAVLHPIDALRHE